MDTLIINYKIHLTEAGCAPGAGKWGAQANLDRDIGPVLPYLNALLRNAQYDHENQILIWSEQGHSYALRSIDIRIANVDDLAQAEALTSNLVARINEVWKGRDGITPRLSQKKMPSVLEIYKLLPGTNCNQCHHRTCMAYAAGLQRGKAKVEICPLLLQPEYAGNKEKILALLSDD